MKLKFILVSALLSLCSYNTAVEAAVREGLYVGAGCGATFDNFEYVAKNIETLNVIKKRGNKTNCVGTAFLGFGYTTPQCFYIGAEVGTVYPKRRITVLRPGVTFTTGFFTDHMSLQEYVTADLLPGYRFCDWLLYGRVGFSYSRLALAQDASPEFNLAALQHHQNKYGLRLGVGLNYQITDLIGIGIDYIYTEFPSISTFRASTETRHTQRTHAQYIGASLIFSFSNLCCWR